MTINGYSIGFAHVISALFVLWLIGSAIAAAVRRAKRNHNAEP